MANKTKFKLDLLHVSEFKIHDASGHAFLSKLSRNAFSLYDKVYDLFVFECIWINNLLVLNILFLLKKEKKKKSDWILTWNLQNISYSLVDGLNFFLCTE